MLAGLGPAVVSHLKTETPSCPVLHLLIKTRRFSSSENAASVHPSTAEVRRLTPDVGEGGGTDKIGWLDNFVLAQILRFIFSSHLANAKMFLAYFQGTLHNITALYTNIPSDSLWTQFSTSSASMKE